MRAVFGRSKVDTTEPSSHFTTETLRDGQRDGHMTQSVHRPPAARQEDEDLPVSVAPPEERPISAEGQTLAGPIVPETHGQRRGTGVVCLFVCLQWEGVLFTFGRQSTVDNEVDHTRETSRLIHTLKPTVCFKHSF